jgi:hypothetical protein
LFEFIRDCLEADTVLGRCKQWCDEQHRLLYAAELAEAREHLAIAQDLVAKVVHRVAHERLG